MKREKSETYPVRMDVLYQGKLLGTTWIIRASNHTDRWAAAVLADLYPFDEFILDEGRAHAKMVDQENDSDYTNINKGVPEFWKVINKEDRSQNESMH